MQVQSINNNSNVNFGKLRAIYCCGQFSMNYLDHIEIINQFKKSESFKKFGEKYDYIAEFYYERYKTGEKMPGTFGLLDEEKTKYSLVISPVKNPITLLISKIKGVSNLPIKFSIKAPSYSIFKGMLKTMTLDDINKCLQLEKDYQPIRGYLENLYGKSTSL